MKRTRSTTLVEIIKPPADLRAYRIVILPNGITTMLISDAGEGGVGADSNLENDSDMEVDSPDGEGAAALCIGIGSFSDLPEIPGFAHFMEHMVFMGSEKFPKENYWDEFLAKNGGDSNAWTDCERTCFFFITQQSSFRKTLDVFAQFFISPLFNKNSVDKEIMAVDNESQMVAANDAERMRRIMSYELVEPAHPMHKFMAGNKKSLKDDPERNNVNVYEKLRSFYQRMYSAHYMTLVVHSPEPLDAMERYVVKTFAKIPNNEIPRPKFIKPPFQERHFNKLIKVIPMHDYFKMDVIWALPPLQEHYKTQAIAFLATLLGHEGKGSILSLLRKEHLALDITGGNDMTGYTHNSTWTAYILSVKLTPEGIKRYEEVLAVIFQYIALLRIKLPVHVFEEQKHIHETKYIFKEDASIYYYVEELAENMHIFPPEHYLCGRTLYFEYNEQLIQDCLDFLRPQGALVLLYNKAHARLPDLKEEPWLGCKYQVSDFDPALIKRLKDVPLNRNLFFPEPNPYIATSFNLIKSRQSTKYPVVVMDEKNCRMWYKKDNTFHMPNAFVNLHFISSTIGKDSISVTLGDIYLTMLLHKLSETLYNATLAGYEYSVEGAPEGMVVVIGGYSEKIKRVTKDTVQAFLELELEESSFNSVLTHLKEIYYSELTNPVEFARAVRYSLLDEKDLSLLERYEQTHNITFGMLQNFVQEFHSSLFVEGFVIGNLSIEDTICIGEMAGEVVRKALPPGHFPKPNLMELPEGDFKCLLRAINQEDTNSCVIHYFQQGLGTSINVCLNEILVALMEEPLFNVLRTEHQLGYAVYCQTVTTHGVLGFTIIVESQANKFNMAHIDELMTKFLLDFEKSIQKIPAEKLNDLVQAQVTKRALGAADLMDESTQMWAEIWKQAYVFDRVERELKALEHVTLKTVLDWVHLMTSSKKRKLSIMIEGCTKTKCDTIASVSRANDEAIRAWSQSLKSCLVHSPYPEPADTGAACTMSTNTAAMSRACSRMDVEEASYEHQGQDYISDLCNFKCGMRLLPYHIIK